MRCLALACGDPVWLLAGREVGELRDEASRRVSPVAGCLAELVAEAGDQGVQLTAFAVWRYFRRNQHTESAARMRRCPGCDRILQEALVTPVPTLTIGLQRRPTTAMAYADAARSLLPSGGPG